MNPLAQTKSQLSEPQQLTLAEKNTGTAIVSERSVYSQTVAELFWWHFSLLIPTIGFKYLYVRRMAFTTGLESIFGSMGMGIQRYVNLLLLVTVDFLEVSLIIGALFLAGRLLLRIPFKALIFASVFLCLMIMGANQYSLLLVASLVSVDTLAISASWAKEHPYIVGQSVGLSEIGFLALAAVWSSFFAVLPSPPVRLHRFLGHLIDRWSSLFLKAVLLASVFGIVTVSRMDSQFPAVLRGYWSSTVIAFFKLDSSDLPNAALPPPQPSP